jgi:hypothetical protein
VPLLVAYQWKAVQKIMAQETAFTRSYAKRKFFVICPGVISSASVKSRHLGNGMASALVLGYPAPGRSARPAGCFPRRWEVKAQSKKQSRRQSWIHLLPAALCFFAILGIVAICSTLRADSIHNTQTQSAFGRDALGLLDGQSWTRSGSGSNVAVHDDLRFFQEFHFWNFAQSTPTTPVSTPTSVAATPEPESLSLFLGGCLSLLAYGGVRRYFNARQHHN